jgi:hypothetical protein
MFDFIRKSGPKAPSAAMRRALEKDGLPAGADAPDALRVIESRGSYSGRKVTYVRIFDPARAAAGAVDVRAYGDLDAHPDLVLWAGHVEHDGTVVLNRRAPAEDSSTRQRQGADRAEHQDDEHLVFRPQGR